MLPRTAHSFSDIDTAPINVYTNDDTVKVVAQMPGWQAEWFDISVEGNQLHLKGESRVNEGSAKKVRTLSRMVRLPFRAQADRVDASYKNGLLVLDLHKSEEDRPKKIAIQTV
jgi:HSP20 family protein